MLVTGEQAKAMGYNPDTMVSQGGKYEVGSSGGSLGQTESDLNAGTDRYINDLLAVAKGDKDFAIKKLTQEHDVAISNNDTQTAQFLESVASALESKVGRIPYDYQVAVGRENAQTKTAIDRLNEDERTWMKQKEVTDKETRIGTQENLSQRGILSGTLKESTGLAGAENKTMEQKLQEQLDTYKRAKGRTTEDVTTASNITLEDLATDARRGVQDVQRVTAIGKESAQRIAEARAKELEQQRELDKRANKAYTPTVYYGNV